MAFYGPLDLFERFPSVSVRLKELSSRTVTNFSIRDEVFAIFSSNGGKYQTGPATFDWRAG
jgi:hypothetical protein